MISNLQEFKVVVPKVDRTNNKTPSLTVVGITVHHPDLMIDSGCSRGRKSQMQVGKVTSMVAWRIRTMAENLNTKPVG